MPQRRELRIEDAIVNRPIVNKFFGDVVAVGVGAARFSAGMPTPVTSRLSARKYACGSPSRPMARRGFFLPS